MPSRTLVLPGLILLFCCSATPLGAAPAGKSFSDPRDAEAASPVYSLHARPTHLAPRGSTRGAAVPAYGVNLNVLDGNTFVRFDAADPSTLEVIAPTSRTLVGGAFLHNDFSRFYTIDYDTGALLYLDTSDGSETEIGATGVPAPALWGLAVSSDTGALFGVANVGDPGSNTANLYAIDTTTGLATLITPFGTDRIVDIALLHDTAPFGGGPALFGIDIDTDELIGPGGPIGPIGFNAEFAEGLDFDQQSGLLYFAAVNDVSPFEQPAEMYIVDTATGHASLVGGISDDPLSAQISAFAIARAPPGCAQPEDIPWLAIAPNTGATPPGETAHLTVTFDATSLTAGVYAATVCIDSDDPDERVVEVPVTLTVE